MTTLAACLLGGSASSRSICSISDIFLYSPPHEKDFEIGRKPISNPKSEIANWTVSECDVQFKISDFGFEMGFRPISKCLRVIPELNMLIPDHLLLCFLCFLCSFPFILCLLP